MGYLQVFPRKVHLDQLCLMWYYTWQESVRDFFDCGSFSAVFLFPTWQFSIKSLGLMESGASLLLLAGRTTLH